jgi:hypothetical protein
MTVTPQLNNLLGMLNVPAPAIAQLTPVAAPTPTPTTSTPQVTTTTNVNQSATFAPVNITPISGSISLLGGGSGGGAINVSQISQPTSNVTTQVSNTFATTENITNQYSENTTIIAGSPSSTGISGSEQASTPSTSIIPTQTATQTATPTNTTSQEGGGGTSWWEYLIIGGVVIGAIYMISKSLKGKKKQKNRSIDEKDIMLMAGMI